MSFQTVIIVGNLGKDPEMRYTPSGTPVTSFSVAVNDNYTASSGEKIERTIWFRVSAWGKQAETCNNYLKKGRSVLVEGRLTVDAATGNPRIYTKQDGTPASSLELSATTVRFLSSRADDSGSREYGGESDSYGRGSDDNTPPAF